MCKRLEISRGSYYYMVKEVADESKLEEMIILIFHNNKDAYGSRKVKKELEKEGQIVSRRRICRIMKRLGLVSKYTVAQFKPHKSTCNESVVKNELNRNFDNQQQYSVVVSDLTYVRVNYKWNYVCLIVDLFNREIIGFSAGAHKDAQLVYDAFATIQVELSYLQMFHTDRGSEFKNQLIDDMLDVFHIQRSLSMKGCPYDNAVSEATFKVFKTEFICGRNFENLDQLKLELYDYVHWFNHIRIHGSLGYLSPVQYRLQTL